ncbi:tyrosine-type recombinase/integrase [Gramella sp. AN32]|uniref:Tyrosine-type recombinase/integrase n=1 Tax=Christiangramia antarctica TaxID=2058158 RepID=A0ABW5X265_9FLAO|nr:tyrosine-type recombinase/integrase [Gramella sp. AN32]
MKTKLGFKYTTGKLILSQIDQLAHQREEKTKGITKEFAQKWGEERCNESERYRYDRIRFLAQFSSYLCDLGIPSYISKLPRYPKNTFIPYIYSQKEVHALFKAADELRSVKRNMNSCLICMPALIRLLYCTGIRIGEALAMTDEDVNLEENYLQVKDSKNGKERIIPISTSLVAVCKEYKLYRDQLPIENRSEYFFVNTNGNKCGQGVGSWFKKCLGKAAIPYTGRNHGPRVHDLRHTFAVTSLASMAEAGVDLYASLPVLSNYLGHGSIGATNHYVRLTANMYPDLIRDVDMTSLNVFPKYNNYEAN